MPPKKKVPAKKVAETAHDKIVSDARKNYYKALENEFSRLVKDACKAHNFGAVEQEFIQYGQYLNGHPDALRVA